MSNTDFEEYLKWQKLLKAYHFAATNISYDSETIAPKAGAAFSDEMLSLISTEEFKISIQPDKVELLKKLSSDTTLNEKEKRMIFLTNKKINDDLNIPVDVYEKYSLLINQANSTWKVAKNKNDYACFAPFLRNIFETSIKLCSYRSKNLSGYDQYLDMFESGMTQKEYDNFFGLLVEKLSPIISELKDTNKDTFLHKFYPLDKQRKFNEILLQYLGFDKEHFYWATSAHPFSTEFSINDVRITTRFNEFDLAENIFSVIHEVGHAFFQANINPEFEFTPLVSEMGLGLHESQSRMLENYIAKRKSFWIPLYPKLQELFPENLAVVSLDEFIEAINVSRPSLIRTESDELTYPFHVYIRYMIEKKIFSEVVNFEQLNEYWNKMYFDILKVKVPNDTMGILQDSHWAGGSVGYFPTYALGSAFAAQFYHKMEIEIPVDKLLSEGKFSEIKNWLKTNIYQYGCLYDSQTLLEKVTGEKFNPNYYIEYLSKKFSEK